MKKDRFLEASQEAKPTTAASCCTPLCICISSTLMASFTCKNVPNGRTFSQANGILPVADTSTMARP